MEHHVSSSGSDTPSNLHHNQRSNASHSRNISTDSTRGQGGSGDVGHNQPGVPILSSLDEGGSMPADPLAHSPIAAQNITKTGSSSRGSSPASSKKKTLSDGVNANCSKKRSPLITRKSATVPDTQQVTPPTSRVRYFANQEGQSHSTSKDCEDGAASGVSNGSGDYGELNSNILSIEVDDTDGAVPLDHKTKEMMEHLQNKSLKIADCIKAEQKTRDANVDEYLKVAANADKQQLARIKAVFEKKNQKSATYIQQLQKKQDYYLRKLKEIENYGTTISHRQPKEVLKEMGHGLKSVGGNIRDGISGLSGRAVLIQKPKEIAYLLKNKFGSADNIKELEDEKDEDKTHHGSATLPPNSGLHPTTSSVALSSTAPPAASGGISGSGGSGGGGGGCGGSSGGGKVCSDEGGSECSSSITSESLPGLATVPIQPFPSPRIRDGNLSCDMSSGQPYIEIMQELQEENSRLREDIDMIKQTLSAEVNHLREGIVEERFRCERLEEQVNDLTELNQNETENLKTAMTDMEEKVQYQSEERIRDLNEVVENCQTRILRMELQQAQQQQQFLTLEGLENSNARVLFVKLINVLLTILQVFLLVVATVVGILTPLLQTRTRVISTATLCIFIIFVYTQISEIRDFWQFLLLRLNSLLVAYGLS